jgi:hypothetical protein
VFGNPGDLDFKTRTITATRDTPSSLAADTAGFSKRGTRRRCMQRTWSEAPDGLRDVAVIQAGPRRHHLETTLFPCATQ